MTVADGDDGRSIEGAAVLRWIRAARPVDLLATHVVVLDELRARGLTRSGKVVGDYAEALVARALGLELADGPAEGYDAIDRATGERYQVKARRISPRWKDVGMGPFRGFDERHFDWFVGVVLGADFRVVRALQVPHAVVHERARLVRYDGTHRLNVGPGLAGHPDVRDVTAQVRSAAEDWPVAVSTEPGPSGAP